MRKSKIILCLLGILFMAQNVRSQSTSLPTLGSDPAITCGTLPNGMKYYFAANPAAKGKAEYSFVQKMDPSIPKDTLYSFARRHFSAALVQGRPFEKFLAHSGMGASAQGYINAERGSISYHLGELASARGDAVIDSTLLVVFSLARAFSQENGQPSGDQAIIISGDIDAPKMLERLKMFSITTPNVPGVVPSVQYKWIAPKEQDIITVSGNAASKVIVRWRDARTPAEYIATSLPIVTRKMAGEFGWVLRDRLTPVFRSNGISVWMDFVHKSSTEGIEDETITLEIGCMRKQREQVKAILATELNRLYTWGIDEVEYGYARDAFRYEWLYRANDFVPSNSLFTARCKEAFLYGAPLTSEAQKVALAYREIPDSTQTRLFNNYIHRLLCQGCRPDSTLQRRKPLVSREVTELSVKQYTPELVIKPPKEDKTEYITSGVIWTFKNGVNVIYKKMNTKGIMYFCLASKGGRKYAAPENFSTIDGVFEESFSNYISSLGMEMKTTLRPSDVRLTGKVPQDNAERMLQVLCGLSERKVNEKVFGPECYKLLVLVGEKSPYEVKTLLSKYIDGLRPGGKWTSAGSVTEQTFETDQVQMNDIMRQCIFPLSASTTNIAIADVARCVLEAEMISSFCGNGVSQFLTSRFLGPPTGNFILNYGVQPVALRHFALGEEHIPGSEASSILRKILFSLSKSGVSDPMLAVYKAMTKNAFEVQKTRPDFFIDIACDRYLDNKDMMSTYSAAVDAVNNDAIRKFYAAASSSN